MLKKAASKLAGLIGDHIFRCVRRTQELGDGKRRQFSRLRKNYCGTVEIQWFARLGQQESTAQDAQKGRPARPQRAKRRRRTLRYVELLSETRTPLADFFSILLEHVRHRQIAQSESRWREWVLAIAMVGGLPSVVSATHEADHRFTVEGFVCGTDGKMSTNIDVLVKDTKIPYGQIVKTDGDGYYKAAFHLHNDNLGDPLLIEANGEQQQQKVSFDPKDLEAERKIQVNFGTGCVQDRGSALLWTYLGSGAVAAAVGGFIGVKLVRSWRKQEQKRGKSQGKRKK